MVGVGVGVVITNMMTIHNHEEVCCALAVKAHGETITGTSAIVAAVASG